MIESTAYCLFVSVFLCVRTTLSDNDVMEHDHSVHVLCCMYVHTV